VGGGVALIFGSPPGSQDRPAQLRAAAGFGDPRTAVDAAQAVASAVRRCIGNRTLQQLPPGSLRSERSAGGVTVHPLECDGRIHGALLVGWPEAATQTRLKEVAEIAEILGLRLDHAHQVAERVALQAKVEQTATGEETGDEILKLSEALFAQDIELLRSNEKLGKISRS
jgi:hypothetical protein